MPPPLHKCSISAAEHEWSGHPIRRAPGGHCREGGKGTASMASNPHSFAFRAHFRVVLSSAHGRCSSRGTSIASITAVRRRVPHSCQAGLGAPLSGGIDPQDSDKGTEEGGRGATALQTQTVRRQASAVAGFSAGRRPRLPSDNAGCCLDRRLQVGGPWALGRRQTAATAGGSNPATTCSGALTVGHSRYCSSSYGIGGPLRGFCQCRAT